MYATKGGERERERERERGLNTIEENWKKREGVGRVERAQ